MEKYTKIVCTGFSVSESDEIMSGFSWEMVLSGSDSFVILL